MHVLSSVVVFRKIWTYIFLVGAALSIAGCKHDANKPQPHAVVGYLNDGSGSIFQNKIIYDLIDVTALTGERREKVIEYARQLWFNDFGKDEVETLDKLVNAAEEFKNEGTGAFVVAIPKDISLESITRIPLKEIVNPFKSSKIQNPLLGAYLAEFMGDGLSFVAEGYDSTSDAGKKIGLHDTFIKYIFERANEYSGGKTVFLFVEANPTEWQKKATAGYLTFDIKNALDNPPYTQPEMIRDRKTGNPITHPASSVPAFKISEEYNGKNVQGVLFYLDNKPWMTIEAAVKIVETVYNNWYTDFLFEGEALKLAKKANQEYLNVFKQRLKNEARIVYIGNAPYEVVPLVPLLK